MFARVEFDILPSEYLQRPAKCRPQFILKVVTFNMGMFLHRSWHTICSFYRFQADLLTLFYMWFPCCTCLKGMINRTYSVVTKESYLIRHQSKPKKTNSNRRDKLQKRLLIVEKKPGCSGSRNMTCDEEQLELVCKLFVDNVSELGSVQASNDQ